jgi:choline dehydrogenase-like flavoprotein
MRTRCWRTPPTATIVTVAERVCSHWGAIVLAAAVVQPDSVGTLRLNSKKPGEAPIIDLNFLATARDRRRMLQGVKLSRSIGRDGTFARTSAFEMMPRGEHSR